MSYRVFRRQFIVARRPITVDDGWRQRELADGWVLSWQEDLPVEALPGAGPRLLLGAAVGGAGRFARLDWPHLTGDGAGALLPIFYGGTEDFAAASTPGLVALALGRDPAAPDLDIPLRHHSRHNYVPAPGTRFSGVRRLLRDQRLDIPAGRVERQAAPIRPLASMAEAVAVAAAELEGFARALAARTPGRIILQLSAGLDTRTVAAAFVAAGVEFETMTLRSPAKIETDVTVARAISRRLGRRHIVSEVLPAADPAIVRAYGLQTGGTMLGWDMTDLVPRGSYRFLRPGDVMVGGACFEIGRGKFGDAFDGLTLETATGAAIWRGLARGEEGPPAFCRFLDDWLAWRRGGAYDADLGTTHYIDQRVGVWAATGQSGLDPLDGVTFQAANNARVFAALVTPEIEDRVAGRLQRQVIERLAPELLDFPFNPPTLRHRFRRPIGWARRLLRGPRAPVQGGWTGG